MRRIRTPRSRSFKLITLPVLVLGLLGCAFAGSLFPTPTPVPTATSTPTATPPPTPTPSAIEVLSAACKAEATLNLMGVPRDWVNYGEIVDNFESTYGVTVDMTLEDAKFDALFKAIDRGKKNNSVNTPDVVDVDYHWGTWADDQHYFQAYKFSNWGQIPATLGGQPAKDPDGMWTVGYRSAVVFEVNTTVVKTVPRDWNDLLNPEYKGQVALTGNPEADSFGFQEVYAAAPGIGGSLDHATQALNFFKRLNRIGNFVPRVATWESFSKGNTPIVITWDWRAFSDREYAGGNPTIAVVYPSKTIGNMFVQAVSASAPHPNCAKLWLETLHSDAGQLAWMKGHMHVIHEPDMEQRGVIPTLLKAEFLSIGDPSSALFPTQHQLDSAWLTVTMQWGTTVGVTVK